MHTYQHTPYEWPADTVYVNQDKPAKNNATNSAHTHNKVCLDWVITGTCSGKRWHCKFAHPSPAELGIPAGVCPLYALTGSCKFRAVCTHGTHPPRHTLSTVPPFPRVPRRRNRQRRANTAAASA
eukprot:TRINITY_DN51962_c0_g1_i1.p1 TRINITY_DN51962_c0_g1~~TRINITY_DN51962_c0_g1_i1.p1  ORF type:complete len:125 (+),score=6.27 TRINITY_DN51962_c0_g1_i1:106-480(+)